MNDIVPSSEFDGPGDRRKTSSRLIVPIEIDSASRQRMFDLLAFHYEGVTFHQFEADLDEKDWAVLIDDDQKVIQGFTTLRLLTLKRGSDSIGAVYSGDTLLAPEYMGERGWLTTWARHVFATAEQHPSREVYWVFAASSYRAYRFLPGFFKTFYPHPSHPIPESWAQVRDEVIRHKYDHFDSPRGVVRPSVRTPYRYPAEVAAGIPQDDPFARFFIESNAGYLTGDLLACITRIDPANVTRAGHRVLGSPPYTPS